MDVSLQRSLSVLDRLLLTHSIWLQLSINPASTHQILQREIVGTFLVCKCSASHRKVLCVRVGESGVCVSQYPIREEDSTFSLECSALSFPDLCRLVAFYTVSRDVLPFPLELPEAIVQATTHTQLEIISHLGLEFWSSQTSPGLPNGPPPPSTPHRTPRVISPCFINPLFLQPPQPSRAASHKRHRFKRSLRVRVSNENSLSLSGGESDLTQGETPKDNSSQDGQRRTGGMSMLRRTQALSPTSEEEDEQMMGQIPPSNFIPQRDNDEPEDGEVCLALERTRAPSLAELDSNSSFSSLEEEDNLVDSAEQWPPAARGTRFPSANPTSTLRRMTAAFVCVFAPERRVARLVDELSRDRRSTFGSLVQDFLEKQRQEIEASTSSSAVKILEGLRRFLSQAKSLLLEAGEIEPPIETLVPENEKDLALEKALFGCVLKPLKVQLHQTLVSLHTLDGSLQRITDSMLACQEGALERLGVRVGVLDIRGIDRAKTKLTLMQRSHSPIDKVLLLLQVCKSVYKAMGTQPDQPVGSEDFLPALAYVLVQSNIPQLLLETEYMMELLDASWLTGEGGYYLTSVYASLYLIQSKPGTTPTCSLTSETQESLREWSRRRGQEAKTQKDNQQKQRFVRVLFQDDSRSAMRTLLWKAGENVDALAQICAGLFGVKEPQHYCLFWRNEGEMRTLPANFQPHELGMHEGVSLSYLRSDHDFSKMRRLTRGGAVDLGESAGSTTAV
ncbi:ras and Rab interactor 3 isoform X2 [Triplophysa rosa]|uniref:ras and Rab interactor 3 isoform X2 n=1 Tax=Triplophysa rosa TaxID=992332 RepID=UPI002545FFDB|nr:ras and Rab interactor 3 isoform X2 [Triplophysa rosa]